MSETGAAGAMRWLPTDAPSFDLAALLTLLMLVFSASDPDFPFMAVAPVSVAVLMAAVIWPALRRSRIVWVYIAVAVIWARLPWLLVMDNHHYLIAYWCVAVASCLLVASTRPEPLVNRNARGLLGLAMGFAVVQKGLSGEFANGAFFEFLLLSGDRFAAFSELVLRVPAADLAANQQVVAALLTPGATRDLVTEVAIVGPSYVYGVAVAMSAWTLLIEGLAAVLFLWPASHWPGDARRLRQARNVALLCFAVTTYAIATVAGFAWILLILGVAQCEEDERVTRFAYCAAFLLVLVYTLPWGSWLGAGLGAGS